ncbi:NAD-dependent epimerase/dehydratase family protein [Afifella marina]|uniref:UDP-glucose 4-epimerase n=1 Tax=Afifella marina DSM 2698 TaxID=1120955 RepID=A0A1G5NIL6_AFIMA|nr:NAD-dependent epimerase/dehydratase family protein [Afifella marina]MBK1623492.1 NAD-dependent dehydratase [Afifella marina DSM 2698]MBK1626485.1 NAD-dependent dehydratase [Afifella marina]MBK5916034.1 NAD-dependent dehydratase [Afifella marina]RAI18361.1 NAD-dependent dehydratase [Afifella marina DSM 2698]SCZ36758.1 UDP-glucose 4-epimerase [Afifella marina DSM 2698]
MQAPLIALTGASGFIGRHLLADLRAHGFRVRVLLRRPIDQVLTADSALIGDLAQPANLSRALEGVDAIVHSAGLAHAASGLPEVDYRTINTDATLRLAEAGARAGAKRFVFLSSVRAQSGPSTKGVLDESRLPEPTDAYGRSKRAAEEGLAGLGIDFVSLRPVLVYGPGVKGNMATLLRLAKSPYPLPFAGLKARRSLLAVENLAEAVRCSLSYPEPLSGAYLVADDTPLTLPEMLRAMRSGLGRPPRLWPFPEFLFAAGARLAGRAEILERLSGDLVVDCRRLKRLGWRPRIASVEGLAGLARASGETDRTDNNAIAPETLA